MTGGGRGIGRAIAAAFSSEGARVSVFSRTAGLAETPRETTGGPRGSLAAYPCDVASRDQVEAAVARARAHSGPADALVNNAGIFLWRPFLKLVPEEWDRVIATNLTGAYNFCRAVVPEMASRMSGRIVNVSSIHGLHGDANLSAHCAAKFGLIGFTQSLAKELREHNVTVNAVCPGSTNNKEPDEESLPRKAPLAEKLRPRDVASAVLWLASDEAAGITGASIEIYGGTRVTIQP
ncbi:MAG: SDR family oxidoreductase [Thermoanaerobaculia bacterium]